MHSETSANTPRVWLVLGDKPGDNAQAELIANNLGLPYSIKRVLPKPEFVLGKPRFGVSLDHLDLAQSDPLQPPWPDLIITVGRRPAMAALWIREQSNKHSKIVILGRPKRWPERFALIIAPVQYQMPRRANVLQLELPLLSLDEDAIRRAAEEWRAQMATLPRPLTALLVGGQTKPFRFDTRVALDLLERARAAAGDGHLYISTSRRTSPHIVATLQDRLPPNASLYCWSPEDDANPYKALLGLADQFIVTGDSISMMVEIAKLGHPLAIYTLPIRSPVRWWWERLFNRLGLISSGRDLGRIHQLLYHRQLAVPLGRPIRINGRPPESELSRVVERIKKVLQT